MSTTPKGKREGVLTFVVPVGQCCMALNSVHCDASHQSQQRTLALTQERFWWPMMAEDCCAIVRGCLHCQAFEGEVPKAPFCPIRVYAPLELVHLDYTSIESAMELNKPLVVKNVLVITDHFMRYTLAVVMKDQTAKTVAKVFYEHFIAIFGVPTKLLSDRGVNFTSALVEEPCAAFGIEAGLDVADHESYVDVGDLLMLVVHLEDEENGCSPTELKDALQCGGHKCTLSDESPQAVKRDVLHVEGSLYGAEVNVPQVESILALKGIPQDGTLAGQLQKYAVKIKCGHLKEQGGKLLQE